MFEIVRKRWLTPLVCEMVISAPRIASSALPGQFLIVRINEKGERIPLTISNYNPSEGTITIVTQQIGASTMELCALNEGDFLQDVVGPLGKPSEFDESAHYVFIAGGVGSAPVYPQAKWLHERGVKVDVILGAKTVSLITYKEELQSVCDNLYVCTDDGSEGFHGLVTAQLEALVQEGKTYSQVVAIGPMIMMKFATLAAKKLGLPIVVSLNTLMVDGTGMCGACRVTVGGKVKFACVDGPEFDGYEVDFDEALKRSGIYREQEKEALENHKCRCHGSN